MKDQKGITLIALVITIIVLLILAGVAIAMLSGDNGILNKASEAAEANKIGEAKDDIGLKVYEAVTAYLDKTYNSGEVPADVKTYVDDATSSEDVIKKVLNGYTSASSKPDGITASYDETGHKITISSAHYQVEGTMTEGKGPVKWGNITKKAAE